MFSALFEKDYWLACADKARAEGMHDRRAKLIMISIAKGYERLAHHAQQRAELLAAIEKKRGKTKPALV